MFITDNYASFYLWWKENLAKYLKVSKYYEHGCRSSSNDVSSREITEQQPRHYQEQHNEEEEVNYARKHKQDKYQAQRNQTNDSDRKRDDQGRWDSRRGGDKKASSEYSGEKGKHKTPEDYQSWGERCGNCEKKNHFTKVCRQNTRNKLHQLQYWEESSSNESKYIVEVINVEKKVVISGAYNYEDKKQ